MCAPHPFFLRRGIVVESEQVQHAMDHEQRRFLRQGFLPRPGLGGRPRNREHNFSQMQAAVLRIRDSACEREDIGCPVETPELRVERSQRFVASQENGEGTNVA